VTEEVSVSQRFAAGQLLAAPSDWPEDRLRQELGRLLDGFGIENVLTYATEAGPADLYPPRRRLFVETRSYRAGFPPYRSH